MVEMWDRRKAAWRAEKSVAWLVEMKVEPMEQSMDSMKAEKMVVTMVLM